MNSAEEIIAANLILPLLKDLVLPKVQSLVKAFSLSQNDENNIHLNFKDYLQKRYVKYLIIDTLTFPNKQTQLDLLYEPLTLVGNNIENTENIEILIDNYPEEFLPKYFRVIIEDTAGMGKSTIVKKLFLSIIRQNSAIPILIELRQINKDNNFINEIQKQLSSIENLIPLEIVSRIISEGNFVFLLDGFDEISKEDKKFVIKELHRFIENSVDNYFLITSRPEDSLVSFGDFQKFTVRPLKEQQSYNLLRRYDTYSFYPLADELIKNLQDTDNESLKEFLESPFLVTLLYKSFEYKKDIPLKKTQFYRQVYDALFESHDLSKEGYLKRDKYSHLHIDDFERVLRYLGYLTSIQNKVEYDKNFILTVLDRIKKNVSEIDFNSSDFLKDLLETVPLFKKDGNYIKWAHKSIQDYFAAKFIWIDAGHNQKSILQKIFYDKENIRFFNVLDLFYELDPKIFESTVLLWLLEDFKSFIDESNGKFNMASEKDFIDRIEKCYNKEIGIYLYSQSHSKPLNISPTNWSKSINNKLRTNRMNKNKHILSDGNYEIFNSMDRKYIIIVFYNIVPYTNTLLKILNKRSPSIANHKKYGTHIEDIPLLKPDKLYFLNDFEDNILNSPELFEIVNMLLTNVVTLNYSNALEKLESLQNNNTEDFENDLVNW